MIETRLMAPGSFTIKLDNPPERIRRLTSRAFATVLVMPGRVTNPAKIDYTDLLAQASYVGIHMGVRGKRNELSGYGPAVLLSLARQPIEQKIPKRPLYNGSSTSWLRNQVLRATSSEDQGLVAGPLTVAAAASTPTKSGTIREGQEPLETLADIARRFDKEWDIRNGYQVEVVSRSSLFTVTPTCIAVPHTTGDDASLKALTSVEFAERDDWDDYATTVAVPFQADDYAFGVAYEVGDTVVATDGTYYECTTAHTSSEANLPPGSKWAQRDPYGEATLGSVPYVSPFSGSAIVARRVVNARNIDTYDDATDFATAQLARYDQVQQDITLDSKTFNIEGRVRAGDNIYAYSPEHGLVDQSAQVPYGGRLIPATTVRVQGIRTAVDDKKSVLLYSWNPTSLTFSLDDLTDWVAFEPEGQTLDLGSPRRRRRRQATALVHPGFRGA